MVDYDYDALLDRIDVLVKSEMPVTQVMKEIIAYCAQAIPHEDWPAFAALAFDDDVDHLRRWLVSLLTDEPPGAEVDGLCFGVFNPVYDDGQPTADMYAAGAHYRPSDPDWACDPMWFPDGRNAHSQVLHDIYRLAYQGSESSLGNRAEYPLALVYTGTVIRALAIQLGDSLRGDATRRGLTVGFDSGDWLCIGTLTSAGFVPSKESQTLVPWPAID